MSAINHVYLSAMPFGHTQFCHRYYTLCTRSIIRAEQELIVQSSRLRLTMYVHVCMCVCMYVCMYVCMLSCFRSAIMDFTHVHTGIITHVLVSRTARPDKSEPEWSTKHRDLRECERTLDVRGARQKMMQQWRMQDFLKGGSVKITREILCHAHFSLKPRPFRAFLRQAFHLPVNPFIFDWDLC